MSRTNRKEIIMVEGFAFDNPAEAEQAKKEVEGVKYIKGKTDMDNPEMVLQIYNKMIEQGLFETAVGYSYLKDLQEYLRTIPFIKNEDITAIPVHHPVLESNLKNTKKIKQEKPKREKEPKETKEVPSQKQREQLKTSRVINIVLLLCVVAMFVITLTSNSPTIVNYESKLIDKYASWDQELTDREQAVKVKEQELNITPTE